MKLIIESNWPKEANPEFLEKVWELVKNKGTKLRDDMLTFNREKISLSISVNPKHLMISPSLRLNESKIAYTQNGLSVSWDHRISYAEVRAILEAEKVEIPENQTKKKRKFILF